MTKSRPHMPSRDRGQLSSINNPDDGTPIREMFTLGERLLLITDKCIYALQMADQIDPERTNTALPPNVQQKLFDHGIQSELLCRSLLHAKVLFRKEFQTIDIEHAMQLAFDAFSDMVEMEDLANVFLAIQDKAIAKARSLESNDSSMTLPAVGNVRAHCKSYMQKADHVAVALISITRLFLPELKGKSWTDLLKLVKDRYGEADNFYKTAESIVPFLQLVRNGRDCLEHANARGAVVRDFELQPDGHIALPTIEIDFRGSKQERCQVGLFMNDMLISMQAAFEMLTLHCCAKGIQPFAGMPMTIGLLNENYQKAWHVRFAYGAYYADGKFVPCG
ncbi:hypothetical protein [Rhizobium rhizogenes]|uniref:hypothetical protein n=1 Tax=Rhizobium rhizogenes TaxID=359 RepID=UPI00157470AD|nr:hypothetical protein [Rhizobium rhizogenes]NTH22982.1 hypothetical protein [Rhizobium rhizogenes]NTH36012.1 hypothetical protein [Rhizobium rhizogenes]